VFAWDRSEVQRRSPLLQRQWNAELWVFWLHLAKNELHLEATKDHALSLACRRWQPSRSSSSSQWRERYYRLICAITTSLTAVHCLQRSCYWIAVVKDDAVVLIRAHLTQHHDIHQYQTACHRGIPPLHSSPICRWSKTSLSIIVVAIVFYICNTRNRGFDFIIHHATTGRRDDKISSSVFAKKWYLRFQRTFTLVWI